LAVETREVMLGNVHVVLCPGELVEAKQRSTVSSRVPLASSSSFLSGDEARFILLGSDITLVMAHGGCGGQLWMEKGSEGCRFYWRTK
jgi:hypothetical protein